MTPAEAIADGRKLLAECEAAGSEFVSPLTRRLVNVLTGLLAAADPAPPDPAPPAKSPPAKPEPTPK